MTFWVHCIRTKDSTALQRQNCSNGQKWKQKNGFEVSPCYAKVNCSTCGYNITKEKVHILQFALVYSNIYQISTAILKNDLIGNGMQILQVATRCQTHFNLYSRYCTLPLEDSVPPLCIFLSIKNAFCIASLTYLWTIIMQVSCGCLTAYVHVSSGMGEYIQC